MIEQMLALSTAHMPNQAPDFGELRALDDEYGIIVFVYSVEEHDGQDVPQWLQPIMKYARDKGCRYIYFDRDVPAIEGFETWDW